MLNDNKIKVVPLEIGQLTRLTKLHLHQNKIVSLPRELSNLTNLKEFSLEWFIYTKPANAKI